MRFSSVFLQISIEKSKNILYNRALNYVRNCVMNGFVKSFVFPFLIALVIFSVIAAAAVPPILGLVFASDESEETIEDESEFSDSFSSTLNSKANGVLSLMLICTENIPKDRTNNTGTNTNNPDEYSDIQKEFDNLVNKTNVKPTKTIRFITIAIFDSILNRVSVTYIPPETQVTVKGAKTDLDTVLFCAENNLYNVTYDYFSDYALSVTGSRPDIFFILSIGKNLSDSNTYSNTCK